MKVHISWAFTDNERQKMQENLKAYEELKSRADGLEFKKLRSVYNAIEYKVTKKPDNLTWEQVALILDNGNLCFGFRRDGRLVTIYTD